MTGSKSAGASNTHVASSTVDSRPSGEAGDDCLAARTREFAETLVRWPSETGTRDEAAFADRLASLIRDLPYFQSHPDQVILVESHGSPKASSVVALVRGRGSRCIALSGHYDTVTVANYGKLAPLACEPDRLTAALIDELSTGSRNPSEDRALADLLSGAFVPGRGMLDMKSGLAAGLACLEHFSLQDDRVGNMLFMAVPDEENRSRGMRSLRDALPEIARRWGLDIAAGINLDATSDLEDGAEGRSIYLGTVGKLLPFAFVVGRPTHAGYPLEGVSAHLIAAEIMRSVEVNPDLCDEAFGEKAPPPVCLEAKDNRQAYDVTMPERAWLAFNWLTHKRTAKDVLALFGETVQDAMDRTLLRLEDNARRFYGSMGQQAPAAGHKGTLLTFAELREQAFTVGGPDARDRYQSLMSALDAEESPLVVSRTLVDHLVTEAQLQGPAVIIGLGSLHYPHTHLDQQQAEHRRFQDTLKEAAAKTTAAHGVSIKTRGFFGGISDVSFFGHRADQTDAEFIRANTPSEAYVDHAAPDVLAFPTVNIGPWGREYHQKLERVHAPYAFEILPELLVETCRSFLASQAR